MREPRHYVYSDGTHCVSWYEGGRRERERRTFSDANEAEVFYQEKFLGAVDKQDLILKEVTTLRKYWASGKIAGVEAENARLRDELAAVAKRLRIEETRRNEKSRGAKPTSGQSINFRTFLWAYEQEGLSVTAKAVLVTYAMHANEHGYSWPGMNRIASIWGMDRETVRRQIEELLVRHKIYPTKKRCGATGQVKVYRLPKNTYESGGKSPPFENHESEAKAGDKRRTSGGKSAPNKEQWNKEQHAAVGSADLQRAQLYAIAATATDSSELVEKLKPHFPSHNVVLEMRDYRKNRNRYDRPITAQTFVDWMLRAHKRLLPPVPPPERLSLPAKPAVQSTSPCSLEIDEQHARFLKEMEDRKSRRKTEPAK